MCFDLSFLYLFFLSVECVFDLSFLYPFFCLSVFHEMELKRKLWSNKTLLFSALMVTAYFFNLIMTLLTKKPPVEILSYVPPHFKPLHHMQE